MTDPIQRAEPFLNQCPSCDAGLPAACNCPSGDYRPVMLDLVREVEKLRAELNAASLPGIYDRSTFAEHASREAILIYLKRAEAAAARAGKDFMWLAELLAQKNSEQAPPATSPKPGGAS